MKSLLLSALLFCTSINEVPDVLTGRWESRPSSKGNVTGIVFKPDQRFEGYINRKPFTSGRYQLTDSIFSFTDNGCNNMQGIYKIVFFSGKDSMRFEPIEDSCTPRKEGMIKLIMGRVKNNQ